MPYFGKVVASDSVKNWKACEYKMTLYSKAPLATDASLYASLARFVNEGFPNTTDAATKSDTLPYQRCLEATRDIQPGEPITSFFFNGINRAKFYLSEQDWRAIEELDIDPLFFTNPLEFKKNKSKYEFSITIFLMYCPAAVLYRVLLGKISEKELNFMKTKGVSSDDNVQKLILAAEQNWTEVSAERKDLFIAMLKNCELSISAIELLMGNMDNLMELYGADDLEQFKRRLFALGKLWEMMELMVNHAPQPLARSEIRPKLTEETKAEWHQNYIEILQHAVLLVKDLAHQISNSFSQHALYSGSFLEEVMAPMQQAAQAMQVIHRQNPQGAAQLYQALMQVAEKSQQGSS